ncbi:TonB-dependent receptor [hydrothermal vent metagenome]|uniref:TonB-dependent receptor n=1 Tax=hydrothermal vent metagenome TaxID=652676 RepID=A0A1W1D190_9ZZZZ
MSLSGTVIEDRLRARASVYEHRSDGYMRNSFLHRDDTQKIDELTAKLQLAWRVSDEHLIDFAFRHLDITNGYDAFSLDNSRTSHADEIGIDAQRTNAFAIKSNYQMNEAMHLVSKLSHSQSNLVYAYDEDWSYIGEFPEQFSPYSAFDSYKREKIQNDIDIKLMGDAEGRIFDDSTDWTLGFYCKKYKEKLLREYSYFEKPFSSTYDTSNTVVYGQFDTAIDDKMVLVSGLRLESWNAKYSDSQELNIENDEVLVGGKLGLSYEENSQTLYYAYLSKGYKPGGVNADSRLITDAKSYYTENLWNLELGINSSYLEDTLINRFNIFYGKREDQQVKSSIVSTREDGSQNFIGYLANAGKSHYYGLESQMDWYLSERIHFYSSIGLLQSTFDTYIDPNPLALNVEGRTPAHSPEYQYVIGFDMTFWEGWIWKSNLEAKGAYYFSNRHDEKSDAYTLVHSSLEYTIGNWSVVAWIRNITNIDYQTRGFGSFGNNPSNGYEVERYTQQGTPRTAGLTLSYDF